MFLKIQIDIKELTESECHVLCSGIQQKAINRFLQRTVHGVKEWDGYFSVSAANSILKDLRNGTDGFASLKGTSRPLAWLRILKILIYSIGIESLTSITGHH